MVVRQNPTGVVIERDGHELALSWTWLRDHARDPTSYLASAQQRIVTPKEVAGAGAGTAELDESGSVLKVSWPEGPTTDFDVDWLASLGSAQQVGAAGPAADVWCGQEIAERIRPMVFDEVTTTDEGHRAIIHNLWRDGLVMLRDVPLDRDATRGVLERVGYVRSTIFGNLWEFRSDGGFDDTASTPLEITPHTDGTYSHDAPGLLGLHCHVYEAHGGENVFVDGLAIAERLSPDALEVLSTVDIPGHYIGDGAHLVARRPALRFQGDRLEQISYNHHDRAPFVLPEPTMTELFDALHELDALANDPSLQFELAMRPGDMVIFDNWRLLHGRRAFEGERLIAGGYINREDFESTTRLLFRPEV